MTYIANIKTLAYRQQNSLLIDWTPPSKIIKINGKKKWPFSYKIIFPIPACHSALIIPIPQILLVFMPQFPQVSVSSPHHLDRSLVSQRGLIILGKSITHHGYQTGLIEIWYNCTLFLLFSSGVLSSVISRYVCTYHNAHP